MHCSTIKLVTLNLWRFTEWETRLPLICDLLKSIDPDIILLQEVQRDPSRDERNQIEIINAKINYPHSRFSRACIKTTRKGVPLPQPVDHGLGVLSKFPFVTEDIRLTQADGDGEPRIVMRNDFSIDGETVTISNIHFANSDLWAENHLKEILNIFINRGVRSICAGDFNIKKLSGYESLYKDSYVSSSDNFEYISYPEDNLSYDYVLVPNEYSLKRFECRDERVSDHKMLVAEVGLKK